MDRGPPEPRTVNAIIHSDEAQLGGKEGASPLENAVSQQTWVLVLAQRLQPMEHKMRPDIRTCILQCNRADMFGNLGQGGIGERFKRMSVQPGSSAMGQAPVANRKMKFAAGRHQSSGASNHICATVARCALAAYASATVAHLSCEAFSSAWRHPSRKYVLTSEEIRERSWKTSPDVMRDAWRMPIMSSSHRFRRPPSRRRFLCFRPAHSGSRAHGVLAGRIRSLGCLSTAQKTLPLNRWT